ncbi:hypothetical protein ACLOJK_023574 [Asimina triloba]
MKYVDYKEAGCRRELELNIVNSARHRLNYKLPCLPFFFTPKKVGHPTPSREIEVGHLDQPQHEERSSPHNAVATRLLPIVDASLLEDQALSNLPDPSRESSNGLVTRGEFHALLEISL